MSNPNIVRLLRESVAESRQEQFNEKLTLIQDIVRVKKFLFGQGFTEHDEFKDDKSASQLFDELYEMNLTQLEVINSGYEKQVNEHMSKRLSHASK